MKNPYRSLKEVIRMGKRAKIEIGQRFSKLTVIEYMGLNSRKQKLWKCKCDCGNEKVTTTTALTSKHTRSCGCLYPKAEDLTGKRFGKLIVLKEVEPKIDAKGNKYHYWECLCDCGNTTFVTTQNLKNSTQSCGCYLKEVAGQQTLKHGYRNSRLYRIYNGMKQRCNNPNSPNYPNYGGRGITVCPEWNKEDALPVFVEWALANGYRDDLSIDRIDNSKGYSPDNYRWANRQEQSNNTRQNVHLSYKGEIYTIAQFSRKYGINHRVVSKMLKEGFKAEEILLRGKK